jgi:hypothetical protein
LKNTPGFISGVLYTNNLLNLSRDTVMLESLKADLAGVIKKIEETAVNLQIMLGQKQGLEHAVSKLEAAAPIVEAIDPALTAPIASAEAVVNAVEADVSEAPSEPAAS